MSDTTDPQSGMDAEAINSNINYTMYSVFARTSAV